MSVDVMISAVQSMFGDLDKQERAREFAILYGLGLHLYPVGVDKRPIGKWARGDVDYVRAKRADFSDMKSWLEHHEVAGWAILCGNPDVAVFTLDIEVDGLTLHPAVFEAVLGELPDTCKRDSVSGGKHAIIRVTDGDPLTTQSLARGVTDTGERPLLAEIRGASKSEDNAGAYAMVTGPGRGRLSKDFKPHPMTRAEVDSLLAPIKALHAPTERELQNEEARKAAASKPPRPRVPGAARSTADIIADSVVHGPMTWLDVLEPGWTIVSNRGGRIGLLRPGSPKSDESANAVGYSLTIHSSEVDWADPQESCNPPQVLAACYFGGRFADAMAAAEEAADMVNDGLMPAAPFSSWPRSVLEEMAAARETSRQEWRDENTRVIDDWLSKIQQSTSPNITPEANRADMPDLADDEDIPAQIRAQFPALNWNDLFEDESEQEWIVEPLLPVGRLIALYSPPKVGKSLLMLELAVNISTGRGCFGYPAKDARHVLYVDFENDPRGDVRPRLEAMGVAADDLEKLHYLTFPTIAALDSEQGGRDLLAAALAYGAEVIVIDTVSRSIAGDENSNDTWLSFYRHTGLHLKRAGIALIRLDHTGKDESKGQRGGSAKSGDVDGIWQIKRKADDVFTLECDAARFYLPEAEKRLTLRRLSDPLRHEVDYSAWKDIKERNIEMAIAALDRLDFPLDEGRRPAMAALKKAGVVGENKSQLPERVIRDAIELRRQRAGVSEIPEVETPESGA